MRAVRLFLSIAFLAFTCGGVHAAPQVEAKWNAVLKDIRQYCFGGPCLGMSIAEIESIPNQGFKLRQELSEWRSCRGSVIVDYIASNGIPFTLSFGEGPGKGSSKDRYRLWNIHLKGRMSNDQMHNLRRLLTERHKMPKGDPFDPDPLWWEKKSPDFTVTVLATRLRDNPVAQVSLTYKPAKDLEAVLAAREECQPGYRDPRIKWELAVERMQQYCMDRLCLGMTVQQVTAVPHRQFSLDGTLASRWQCRASRDDLGWKEDGEVVEAAFASESGAVFKLRFKDGPGGEDPSARYRLFDITLTVEGARPDDLEFLRQKLTDRYKFENKKRGEGFVYADGAREHSWSKHSPMFRLNVETVMTKRSHGTVRLYVDEKDPDYFALLMQRPECSGQGPMRRAKLPKI